MVQAMSSPRSTHERLSVRTWRSFSSNNSSSHYLVARFESSALAATSAAELREFFCTHAIEIDRDGLKDAPTEAAREFAKTHQFEWSQLTF